MLREITNVRQYYHELKRRWFYDPSGLDLLVWVDDENKPVNFQLSINNKTITYMNNTFNYSIIDDDRKIARNMTPILRTPSSNEILTEKDKERILNQFEKDSKYINTSIKNFLTTKLNEYFK